MQFTHVHSGGLALATAGPLARERWIQRTPTTKKRAPKDPLKAQMTVPGGDVQ
jgi:hypothetical protein